MTHVSEFLVGVNVDQEFYESVGGIICIDLPNRDYFEAFEDDGRGVQSSEIGGRMITWMKNFIARNRQDFIEPDYFGQFAGCLEKRIRTAWMGAGLDGEYDSRDATFEFREGQCYALEHIEYEELLQYDPPAEREH